MKHRWFTVLVALALPASSLCFAPAHAEDAPPPVPSALRPAIAGAESTARTMQRLDRAAWLASDALQEDRGTRKLRRAVRGWITEPLELGTRVSFFDGSTPARLLYAVDVESTGRLVSTVLPADTIADARQQAMIRVRQAASSESFLRCSRTYNTVVFPVSDAIHVYVMASTTKTGVFPAGGHHLFVYDAQTEALRSRRSFSNGCIDLGGGGERTAGLMVTHLLDPHPTEIHAFISLNAGMPLYVATSANRALWTVKDGQIALMRPIEDPAGAAPAGE